MSEESSLLIIVSLGISVGLFLVARTIIKRKMGKMQGTPKLLGIITIAIGFAESAYLGISFGLYEFALEIVTSVGVGIILLGVALQHQLKNIVSGIGLLFNTYIDIGDTIRLGEIKGTIIEIHLTKTIALTEDGEKIHIPNQKFSEDVMIISNKEKTDDLSKR